MKRNRRRPIPSGPNGLARLLRLSGGASSSAFLTVDDFSRWSRLLTNRFQSLVRNQYADSPYPTKDERKVLGIARVLSQSGLPGSSAVKSAMQLFEFMFFCNSG
jgi:hypothetical protein